MTQGKKDGNLIAIITMCFMFAMISFVTNMAAPFGNIWGNTYSWAGMMGNMMNFAAYLFMGIPAGKMIVKYGYKTTALVALAIGAIGLFIQYLSSIFGADAAAFNYGGQVVAWNLIIYLLGAFVCGFCVCMLNTVVNPMLNLLGGGGNKGNQLIQTGGALNSLSGTLTPLFVGVLIGQVTPETSMSDVSPLLFIGIAVFVLSFFIIKMVDIPEPQLGNKEVKYEHSPLAFRHTLLGVIGIFFYVGIEIGIPAQLMFFITGLGFEGSAAVGGALAASYWFMMLIGRSLSSVISGKVSSAMQLKIASALAIIFILIAIFMPDTAQVAFRGNDIPVKCFFLAACGLCTSVMWGGIFNLAVEGLGKYTALASGIFMTMVVGGGVMPLIQDFVAKATDPITSYWVVVAMLAYLLYYALIGCKNVNKDIKVD